MQWNLHNASVWQLYGLYTSTVVVRISFWVVLAGANPFRTSFGNIKCSDWFIRGALLYYQSIDLEYESYKDAVGLVQQ